MTRRQDLILNEMMFGLVGSIDIDQIIIDDENPGKKSKQNDILVGLERFNNSLFHIFSTGNAYNDLAETKIFLACEAKRCKQNLLRPKLKKVSKDISRYLDHMAKDNRANVAKDWKMREKLKELVAIASDKTLKQLLTYQTRDIRWHVMDPLIRRGLVRSMPLRAKLHEEFGEKAYFLTPDGADYLLQYVNSGYWGRDSVRAYEFTESIALHELMVSGVLRSLCCGEVALECDIDYLLNEAQLRSYCIRNRIKSSTLADILIRFEFKLQAKGIVNVYLEIDTGTQPQKVNIKRAETLRPFILICRSDDLAYRRWEELFDVENDDWFITTYDRVIRDSILYAEHLSRWHGDFYHLQKCPERCHYIGKI